MDWIRYDIDTFDKKAMEALRKRFPNDEVTDECFNHNYSIKFADGKYGYAGTANGDLAVDIYSGGVKQLENDGQPDDGITVATVFYTELDWVTQVYYPELIKANEEETDFVMQQSINSSIGWVNCLTNYDIEPNKDDMDDFMLHYIQLTGGEDEEDEA